MLLYALECFYMLLHALIGQSVRTRSDVDSLSIRLLPAEAGKNWLRQINFPNREIKLLLSVNKRHDFTGIHDINGNFPYDDIFRQNHERLY